MTSLTDVGFVRMRLGKVVAVADQDGPSCCVVLEGVTHDAVLPISIGETEALNLSATLTGVQFGRPMSPQLLLACCAHSAAESGRCGLTSWWRCAAGPLTVPPWR